MERHAIAKVGQVAIVTATVREITGANSCSLPISHINIPAIGEVAQ
jgi:hypothetical protein